MAKPYSAPLYNKDWKVAGKTKTADLVHFDIFAWKDANPKNKIISSMQKNALDELSRKISSELPKNLKSFWVLKSEEMSYRFSESVAKECSIYIRNALLTDKYGGSVKPLTRDWIKRKHKISGKSAKSGRHVGVVFGEMARSIDYFRTNQRSAGEKNHTGYVVGIRGDATGAVFDKAGERVSTKVYESTKKRKNKDTGVSEVTTRIFSKKAKFLTKSTSFSESSSYINTASPQNKLAWLEKGRVGPRSKQVARPVYSMAVKDFLIEYGFEIGEVTVLKSGIKKAGVRKNSKASKILESGIK